MWVCEKLASAVSRWLDIICHCATLNKWKIENLLGIQASAPASHSCTVYITCYRDHWGLGLYWLTGRTHRWLTVSAYSLRCQCLSNCQTVHCGLYCRWFQRQHTRERERRHDTWWGNSEETNSKVTIESPIQLSILLVLVVVVVSMVNRYGSWSWDDAFVIIQTRLMTLQLSLAVVCCRSFIICRLLAVKRWRLFVDLLY